MLPVNCIHYFFLSIFLFVSEVVFEVSSSVANVLGCLSGLCLKAHLQYVRENHKAHFIKRDRTQKNGDTVRAMRP